MCDRIVGSWQGIPVTGCCQGGMWETPALTLVEDTNETGPAVHAFVQIIAVRGSMALTQQLCLKFSAICATTPVQLTLPRW